MVKTKAQLVVKTANSRDEYGTLTTSIEEIAKLIGHYVIDTSTLKTKNGAPTKVTTIKFITSQVYDCPKDAYLVINKTHYLITSYKALYKRGTVIEAIKNG